MSRQLSGSRIPSGPLAGWYRCGDCGAVYPTEWKVRNHRCKAGGRDR